MRRTTLSRYADRLVTALQNASRSTAAVGAIALLAALVTTPQRVTAQTPAATQPAAETQFTILIFEGNAQLATRTGTQQDAYWTAYDEFAGALMRGGVLRGGSALSEVSASTVRGTGSADKAVRAGRLGGYFVIAAKDLAEANRWAKLAPPQATLVEVRPHRENPHMAKMPSR